jgi:hypothetical protein
MNRPNDPEHSSMLRFVDYKTAAETGFPARLFASHLIALASSARSLARREAMFRTALTLVPPSNESEGDDPRDNTNNWAALEGLGSALIDLGRVEEGLNALSQAARASPRAMRSLAEHFRAAIGRGELPPPDEDPRSRFWSSLGA